ncbi:MAG: helix-hairpin-helix domain-containing protein [Ignavibacteria bacterium]|nr:helix-hairpin-helix domain-containing protein [Ignavibacteria bacterium]
MLEFDYGKSDSLFVLGESYNAVSDDGEKITEKGVDSNRELLDFRVSKNEKNKENNSFSAVKNVRLNHVGADELALLPGIGPKTAKNIIEYRNKYGKFSKIEELLNVKGIGKAKFDKIKSIVTVN